MLDQNATIMIVDDTRMMRETLKHLLKGLGYDNLVEAGNGREAMNHIDKDEKKADLIFLDIVMPIMDGKETLKKLREKDDKVPVVMLTSIADKDTIIECRKDGVFDYVLKPINVENGPDILSKILARL